MPTYYLGLDVHKVRTQYCLMDPAGEILAEGSLPTEEVASGRPRRLRRRPRGDRQLAPHLRRPARLRRRGQAGAPLAREGDRLGAREDRQDRRAHPRPPAAHRPRPRGLGAARRGARAARPRAPSLALRGPAHHGQEPHQQPARAPSACASRAPTSSAAPAAPGSPTSRSTPTAARSSSCCSPPSTRRTPTSARSRRCCASASRGAPEVALLRPSPGSASSPPRRSSPSSAIRTASPAPPRSPPTSASCPGCAPRPTWPTTGASRAPARRTRAASWSRPPTSPCACPDRCATATLQRARRRGKKVALVAAARELLELSGTLLDPGRCTGHRPRRGERPRCAEGAARPSLTASLDIDLGFQDFASELVDLPGDYVPPSGALLLAMNGAETVGCVALRPFEASFVAEIKRLYVVPAARNRGLGVRLAEAALDAARAAGYARSRLDTLSSMRAAQRLYEGLGFRDIDAYRHNPHEARYLELAL